MKPSNQNIIEYLVELKKAKTRGNTVKETTMKLLLEKEAIKVKDVIPALGLDPTTKNPADKMIIRRTEGQVRNLLRKLYLDGYVEITKKGEYYLDPELRNQYNTLKEALTNTDSNPVYDLLKPYLPEGEENADY
jgi:hypothetical protein